jgi:hypothetical protein
MDFRSIDATTIIDIFLLLLIGIGPKIALVPFLELTAKMDDRDKSRVVRKTTDGTGTGSDSHQRLSDIPHFMRTGTRNEHLRQSLCNLWLIATVSLKGWRVELPGAVWRDIEVFDRASARQETHACRSHCDSLCVAPCFPPHSAARKWLSSSRMISSITVRVAWRISARRY